MKTAVKAVAVSVAHKKTVIAEIKNGGLRDCGQIIVISAYQIPVAVKARRLGRAGKVGNTVPQKGGAADGVVWGKAVFCPI